MTDDYIPIVDNDPEYEEDYLYDDPLDMTDAEADVNTLTSAGMGTDEDYYPDTPLGDELGGE
jgi:hypothetical protein